MRETEAQHASLVGLDDPLALVGVEAVYEDLAALGAGEDVPGRHGEGQNRLVVLHPVGEHRGAARARHRLLGAACVHGAVILGESCH